MRRFLEWLADELQKRGYLPQHHSIDPRLKHQQYDRHGRRIVSEEEMSELRDEVLGYDFTDPRKK
ncbi:MAG: hypothetical protein WC708_00420 [Lentisphaeria bacterium]|jgi:hypothetical protein